MPETENNSKPLWAFKKATKDGKFHPNAYEAFRQIARISGDAPGQKELKSVIEKECPNNRAYYAELKTVLTNNLTRDVEKSTEKGARIVIAQIESSLG